jgi:hypothetical protein
MANQDKNCELCKKAPREPKSLLCQGCAEAVDRVMPSEIYEANHDRDRQAQRVQARLFAKAAKTRGK